MSTQKIAQNEGARKSEYEPKQHPSQENNQHEGDTQLQLQKPIQVQDQTANHEQEDEPVKRRKYSKNGCSECKRRKIKCDESKPICWHCKRLGKVCVYLSKQNYPYDQASQPLPQPLPPQSPQQQHPMSHPQPYAQGPPPPPPSQQQDISYALAPHQQYNQQQQQQQQRMAHLQNSIPPFHHTYPQHIPPFHPGHPLTAFSNGPSQIPLSVSPLNSASTNQQQAYYVQNQYTLSPTFNPGSTNRTANSNNGVGVSPPIVLLNETNISSTSTETSDHNVDLMKDNLSNNGGSSTTSNTSPTKNKSLRSPHIGSSHDPLFEDNLLANNLNDLLTTYIGESKTTVEDDHIVEYIDMFNNIFPQNEDIFDSVDANKDNLIVGLNGEILDKDDVPSYFYDNNALEFFQLNKDHKYYLHFFYHDYSRVILPFTPSPDYNPVRQILMHYAKSSNYLLAAMLACGALQSYRSRKDPKDEMAYCSYLASCLKLLSTKLKDESKLKDNDETMLLCVLLLTSYSATSLTQKWRPHLRGAKNLLDSYKNDETSTSTANVSAVTDGTTTSSNTPTSIPEGKLAPRKIKDQFALTICRVWFAGIEILANLSAPSGGSLQTDEEFDSFWMKDYESYLNRLYLLGLVTKNGFNYVFGYTNSCALGLLSLSKLIKRKKNYRKKLRKVGGDKNKLTPIDHEIFTFLEIHNLFKLFVDELDYSFIDKSGLVPLDHPVHPKNRGLGNTSLPAEWKDVSPEAIDKFTDPTTNEEVYFSWYDISHQGIVMAAYLVLCSWINESPRDHIFIQQIIRQILSLMHFLKSDDMKFVNSSPMLVQWPIYVAGLHCIRKCDRDLVVKFFNKLNTDLGAGSASISLSNLRRTWSKYDKVKDTIQQPIDVKGETYPTTDDEDDVDLISY